MKVIEVLSYQERKEEKNPKEKAAENACEQEREPNRSKCRYFSLISLSTRFFFLSFQGRQTSWRRLFEFCE